jgi:1-acyl-sn-glycerol-3-phosphate acyltransferase
MRLILRKIHLKWTYFTLVWLSCIFLPFIYLFRISEKTYPLVNAVRKLVSYLLLMLSGIYVQIERHPETQFHRGIYCPNHSSFLDIFFMNIVMDFHYFFMGKQELLDNFITKPFFKSIDVPVQRDSRIAAAKAYLKTKERVKQGFEPVIFPEGGIFEQVVPNLSPFKEGAFKLAEDLQMPVIPVSIIHAWKIMTDDGAVFGSRPGLVKIKVLKPIFPENISSEDLKKRTFEAIQKEIDESNS